MNERERKAIVALSTTDIIRGCRTNFTCPSCGKHLLLNDCDDPLFYCPFCGQDVLRLYASAPKGYMLIGYRGISNDLYAENADSFADAVLSVQRENRCTETIPVWKGTDIDGTGPRAPWSVVIRFQKDRHAYIPSNTEMHTMFALLTEIPWALRLLNQPSVLTFSRFSV